MKLPTEMYLNNMKCKTFVSSNNYINNINLVKKKILERNFYNRLFRLYYNQFIKIILRKCL